MPDKQAIWFLSGTEEPQSVAKPSSFLTKALITIWYIFFKQRKHTISVSVSRDPAALD